MLQNREQKMRIQEIETELDQEKDDLSAKMDIIIEP